MKAAVLIFLISLHMNEPTMESFINQHIDGLPYELFEYKVNDNEDYKAYLVANENVDFLNRTVNELVLEVNSEDIIQTVSFELTEIIDNLFYQSLVQKYGKPSTLKRKIEDYDASYEEYNGISAKITKAKLVDCDIEDNPVMINWKKSNFLIILSIDYDNKSTYISFQNH